MTAASHAYEVQLADILDPTADYPGPVTVHVGADHLADATGNCGRCRTPWPCRIAVTLGELQGLHAPEGT